MRIARFVHQDEPKYGVVEGEVPPITDGTWDTSGLELAVLDSDPFFSPAQSTGEKLKFDDVRLVSPILPRSKVIGVGRNFADHAAELGNEVPVSPLTFFKQNTSVIGPGDPIRLAAVSEYISNEGELSVIIGSVAKGIRAENAMNHCRGYTAGNYVTLRCIQQSDNLRSRAKSFDTSCPRGPWIETELDVGDV